MNNLRPILLVSVLLSLGGLAFACGGDDDDGSANTENGEDDELVHGLTKAQAAEVLVKVGDEEITVGEFAEQLADQSPYLRARYNTPERRREFLNNMVRFELLAQEAERQGLHELPEVVRTRKQVMIQQMMKELFEDRIRLSDVTDEEVRQYYEERASEFNKPAQVRASHIFIKNRATAQQVLRQVLAAPEDMALFRRLAQRYDEDPETNAGTRRGDLRFFGIDGTRSGDADDPDRVPAAVAEAAFQIENIGGVFGELVEGRRWLSHHQAHRPASGVAPHARGGASSHQEPTLAEQARKLRRGVRRTAARGREPRGERSGTPVGAGRPHRCGSRHRAARDPDALGHARRHARHSCGADARGPPYSRELDEGDGGDDGDDGDGGRVMRVVALACLVLTASSIEARADVIERVVATINDEAVFLSELRRRATPFLPQVMQQPDQATRMAALRQLYTELLERLIDEELFQQAARRMQVRVTSSDVERAVRNVIQQNGLTEDEFWEAVEAQGYTRAQYRSDLRRQLLRLKVLNQRVRGRVNITEADVREAYDQRVRRANRSQRFRASQIFVPVGSDASASELAEARARARAIRSEVTADNFAQAMEQHGGGELGWLRQGDLSEDMESVLLTMEEDTVSDPIRSSNGFHIFLLHERERGGANLPSYDDMKDELYQAMLGRQMERQETSFLQELRRDAIISRRL